MRPRAIIALLTLLIMPCIAEPGSIMAGPYKVSFDIGSTRDYYDVALWTPIEIESAIGDKGTEYAVEITSKLNQNDSIIIKISYFKDNQTNYTAYDLKETSDLGYGKYPEFFENYSSEVCTIDGTTGVVISLMALSMNNTGNKYRMYQANYLPIFDPTHTYVMVVSLYPWNEGTLQLLKTIHVEKINSTSLVGPI